MSQGMLMYEVQVPEGVYPGTAFQANVGGQLMVHRGADQTPALCARKSMGTLSLLCARPFARSSSPALRMPLRES